MGLPGRSDGFGRHLQEPLQHPRPDSTEPMNPIDTSRRLALGPKGPSPPARALHCARLKPSCHGARLVRSLEFLRRIRSPVFFEKRVFFPGCFFSLMLSNMEQTLGFTKDI